VIDGGRISRVDCRGIEKQHQKTDYSFSEKRDGFFHSVSHPLSKDFGLLTVFIVG
jgi:hypothetical protein